MGRIGFALRTDFDAAIAEAIAACTLPGLEMTGLFQHFSVADDTAEENIAYTAEQHRLFVQACSALTAAGQLFPAPGPSPERGRTGRRGPGQSASGCGYRHGPHRLCSAHRF